jgi:hypothetical protein
MSRPIPLLLALFDDRVDLSLYRPHVLRCGRESRARNLPSADNGDMESESATRVLEENLSVTLALAISVYHSVGAVFGDIFRYGRLFGVVAGPFADSTY